MKRLQTYTVPGITVTFDPNVCIHSGVCLRTLPMVFDVRRKRWIAPACTSSTRFCSPLTRMMGPVRPCSFSSGVSFE